MAKWIKNADTVDHTWLGQLVEDGTYYEVQANECVAWANDTQLLIDIAAGDAIVAKDDSGSEDITDVSDAINHLKDILSVPSDTDGVPLSRTKITKTGWHFQAQTVEFTTSKLSSIYNKDVAGTDLGFATTKYYDVSDVELVAGTQAELDTDCVRTVVEWEPTHDYEVIGGTLYQSAVPSSDVRLWITAVPDLTPAQGGSIPFAQGGLNLKHMGTGAIMELDGKTPKLMSYDATYHTNKFQLLIKHDTGSKSPVMLVFKVFEE